jgi:hypothetical protein
MRIVHRHLVAGVLALAGAVAAPAAALAHGGGDPHFLSVVQQVTPATSGLKVEVLSRDDRLLLINHSGKDVVVEGYSGEPYVRVLAGGSVQVNTNSPAHYLNDDRYGAVDVPAHADAKASPRWKDVDRTSRFEWHDHRIHWMAKSTPPQVRDKDRETKIFDWAVPIEIAGTRGEISGTLSWTPMPGGQAPLGAVFGGSAVVVVLCIAAIVIRRRRDRRAGSREAW